MADWNEEFKKKYNKPVIEQRTVGFSGIDPQQKSADVDVDAAVQDALNKIQLLIDGGEITLPDYPTPEPIIIPEPTPIVFEEINHERLGNLLGGTDEGHYHLTGDELDKLRNMPTSGIQGASGKDGKDGQSATVSIGTVTTLVAGSPASVTNSGTSSNAILNFSIPRGADGHDGVDGHDGHDGHDGVDGITPNISVGTVTTGAAGSQAKVTKRGSSTEVIFDFAIPKGDKGTAGTTKHEELSDLQGGESGNHYHITGGEHEMFSALLSAMFRPGAEDDEDETIVMPASFNIDLYSFTPSP